MYFTETERSFYSLEDLWGDALRLDWETVVATH
jgi:ribosomal silencing factor RsfS